MDSTVIVAGMGLMATILAASLTSISQRRGERDSRILEARVRVYGDCSESLYEYARATFNRAKARLANRPQHEREVLRQEAYRCNAKASGAIGQAAILSGDEDLEERLDRARHGIGTLNETQDEHELKRRQGEVIKLIKEALAVARSDLMR